MGRLILSTSMTVDGVISVTDWYVSEGGHDQAGRDLFARTAVMVLGRKTYEGLAAYWPEQEGPWADLIEGERPLGNDVRVRMRLVEAKGFDSGVTLLRYEL